MITRRWFHPSLNGVEAEKLLLECGRDGSFLARPSMSNKGDFTLSVRRGKEVTHIKIQNNGEFLDLYGGDTFATLSELVQYYMDNTDALREKSGSIIRLKSPLNCADPTTERWYHGQLTAKEAERMMLENGKNGSFLVRESQSQPGDFVVSVRTRDHVTHIIIRRHGGLYDIGGGQQFPDLVSLVEHYRAYPMVESTGDVVRLVQPLNATRLQVRHLPARVKQLQKENEGPLETLAYKQGFWEEFETLQMMENLQLFDRMEGSKPENIRKNRYKNIIPFDHTRVVLKDIPEGSPAGADYINANYIRCEPFELQDCSYVVAARAAAGAGGGGGDEPASPTHTAVMVSAEPVRRAPPAAPRRRIWEPCLLPPTAPAHPGDPPAPPEPVYNKTYIATQGCLPSTVHQFWSMIWQEDVRIIIMTTKEIERGKVKCERYWPELGKSETIKNLTVSNEEESSTQDYTLRRFKVMKEGSVEGRSILHFHFTAWPDHGVPGEPGRVLNILMDVNLQLQALMEAPDAPAAVTICVHCSAGIGRTGTFIVIDMILDQIRREGFDCEIDVHRTVQMVRDQRSGMVQNEAQYKFIYLAVLEFVETVLARVGQPSTPGAPSLPATPSLPALNDVHRRTNHAPFTL
ncbi:unnamed protein product [Plutella xylostella]|uniref:protein-tyrosine-phosphatase n=1 Tax=Plutella xylostella TaxID=51655 RepID=A0A8S4D418_PLUXY|nr:unnamed protein product [Plutella xylostella]